MLLFTAGIAHATKGTIPIARPAIPQNNNVSSNNTASGTIYVPIKRPIRHGETSRTDIQRYREIFELQANSKWRKARVLIAHLYNPILMGHVLHQRYMHPNYRAGWRELRRWLQHYGDHPGAQNIYALLKHKKPRSVNVKPPPTQTYHGDAKQSALLFQNRYAQKIRARVEDLIGRERPTQALNYVRQQRKKRRINQPEYDTLRTIIARSYYIEGKFEKSFSIARLATANRAKVPTADWQAGLAAWRLEKYDVALRYFEYLADNPKASPSLRARGAFWAARVLREAGETIAAKYYLTRAATQGHSFYALLAQQSVYGDIRIKWEKIDLGSEDMKKNLINSKQVKRAILLVAAGTRARAEWELTHLEWQLGTDGSRALLQLARDLNSAETEFAIARRFAAIASRNGNKRFYQSLYPILNPEVTGKFTIDRAIIFGLIRRESRFKLRAYSRARAHGLMQLIPSTASVIAGDRRLKSKRRNEKLFDPKLNLKLGQKYLHLLFTQEFNNNLIHVLAAYNAGPERIHNWRKRFAKFADDPLLYIESIPFRETRQYVRYVLENIWIYRNRLGQTPISQQVLINYGWPLYVPQDTSETGQIAHLQKHQ